ncbi:MAG TPA: proline--tRNA ligase [Anaerolineae bacterium]|nr:proline--tRNA ligase [Caldilineae bacterium]HID34178.1 proline--tRNA ligase [Anaerolineae bacterium]HIQ11655.1 proline--tRNA ligase [Caldilineales bacterium]
MRLSHLFGETLREAPADAEFISHQLLVRAGYIRQLGAGIFSYLPLARRVMDKIENIMREEMNAIGGQEMTMPVVHPAEIWKETGRWYQIGSEMGRMKDSTGRDMVLAMTHEEVVTDLVRDIIHSYRQLPALIYHIQTKWRDEPRSRGGLIRVREFTMKDSYSLDRDWEGLDKQYWAHYRAYFNIFNRCDLPTIAVESDVGMMGGKQAHEFMYLTPIGEDTLVICDACGYTANRQVATFRKPEPEAEDPQPLKKVATPDTKTIEDLANFLGVPQSKTAKAVFMVATITEGEDDVQKFVFAVVRGDMDLNETKLANGVKAKELRPAHEEEIQAIGAEPGYGSPIGIRRENVMVVVDDLVTISPNLVAGSNEEGYHFLNVNYGRDFTADIVADIVAAADGYACPECGAALRTVRGVEVGNIFKLGTRYSAAMGALFQDKDGTRKPVIMGSYGIGVGRLMASVVEEHHDDYGIIWPIAIAPYQVHIVALRGGYEMAEKLYEALQAAGVDVLYDDRTEPSPGEKFNDADLIGIPLRLTVGGRSLKKGGVELKRRAEEDVVLVPVDEVVDRVKGEIEAMTEAIMAKVRSHAA